MGTGNIIDVVSQAKGIDVLNKFITTRHKNGVGIDYAMLMELDGKFSVHQRWSMPCYGELRPYAQGSSSNGPYEPNLMPEEQRKVHKPGDLFFPFPAGHPIAVAVPFRIQSHTDWNTILETIILNPETSPWRTALKEFTVTRKDKQISGIIITDTHINPTIMVNMFRNIRTHTHDEHISWWNTVQKASDLTPFEAYILSQIFAQNMTFIKTHDYCTFGPNPNYTRLLAGEPVDRTGGTFYARYAYDRPKQDHQWDDGEDKDAVLYKRILKLIPDIKGEYAMYDMKKHFPIIVDEFKKLIRVNANKFAKVA